MDWQEAYLSLRSQWRTIVLAIAVACCVHFIYSVIYQVFYHPLASFKGPLLAKISHIYTIIWELKANRVHGVHKLLQRYGSPVRIGPNELAFADEKSFNEIYAQKSDPWPKSSIYNTFSVTGSGNILSITDRSKHNAVRRLFSHAFSMKNLRNLEGSIAERVQDYIDIVFRHGSNTGQAFDVYHPTGQLALDNISNLTFGQSLDTLKGRNEFAPAAVDAVGFVLPLTSLAPILKHLPIKTIRQGVKGVERLERLTRSCIMDYIKREQSCATPQRQHFILHDLIRALVDHDTPASLRVDELVDNSIIFLVAGTETTTITICCALWECARSPEVQKRLIAEIRGAFTSPDRMPTYDEASNLPYLKAVIEETLRLWGPLSNARLLRISNGRLLGEHFVPAGTTVVVNMHSASRDPIAFPQPEKFIPERWLSPTPRMNSMSRPFSFGPHSCLGKHVAEMSVFLTLARVFQLFDVSVDKRMSDEIMEIKDYGTMRPNNGEVFLRASPARL